MSSTLAFIAATTTTTSSHTSSRGKRPGALWAHYPDTPLPLSLPMALGASLFITVACATAFGPLHLAPAPAPLAPLIPVRATLVDVPMPKPTEPVKPMQDPVPPKQVQTPTPKHSAPVAQPTVPALTETRPSDLTIPTKTATDEAPPTHATESVQAPTPPSTNTSLPSNASSNMGVVCPTQIKPTLPRAAAKAGITGTVHARALVQDGVVKEVTIVSGPSVFHGAVRAAMMSYKCERHSEAVMAEQDFVFDLQ